MVTQVTYKHVKENSSYRRGFVLTFPPGKFIDLFFEVDGNQTDVLKGCDSPYEYLEKVQNGLLPQGIQALQSLDNNRYFRITCDRERYNGAVDFAKSLFERS